MKRILVAMFVMGLAMGSAFAVSSITDVDNKHNLSSTGPGATGNITEVCVFCHTPHQDPADTDWVPLWNHTESTNANYGAYSSTTMNSTATDIGGLATVSNLCMSCHDGTVAVGSMYNEPNSLGTTAFTLTDGGLVVAGDLTGAALIGIDLTNDHPINMTYADAVAAGDDLNATPANAVLFGGTVQCASCHNVHDGTNAPFLRISNTNSNLCTDCHTK